MVTFRLNYLIMLSALSLSLSIYIYIHKSGLAMKVYYQVLKSMKDKIPQPFTTWEITHGLRQCDGNALLDKVKGP